MSQTYLKAEDVDQNMRIRIAEDEPDVAYHLLSEQNAYLFGLGDTTQNTKFTATDTAIAEEKCSEGVRWYNRSTATAQFHFSTESKKIRLRALLNTPHSMGNLSPVGQCGFNLYLYNAEKDRYDFIATSSLAQGSQEVKAKLVEFDTAKKRHFLLFFPMYAGAKEVELGIEKEAHLYRETLYRTDAQILFYGTSITQGGCACRGGLIPPSVLSRTFRIPVINLGFSGNAMGEEELFTFMTHYENVKLIVLDYEANAGANGVKRTIEKGISILRETLPTVKIVLCSRLPQLIDLIQPGYAQARDQSRAYLRDLVATYNKTDPNIYFADGTEIFGENWSDYLVDGGHPNDLGFARVTGYFTELFQKLLNDV